MEEPVDRRLAMERHRHGSGWFPPDAFDWFQQFRHRRRQCNGRTQLESELQGARGLEKRRSLVRSEGLHYADSRNLWERLPWVDTRTWHGQRRHFVFQEV